MKLRRNLKLLVAATTTGAAVAYLMDPVAGRRRRERLARVAERRSADIAHLKKSAERVKDAVATDPGAVEDTADAQATATTDGIRLAQHAVDHRTDANTQQAPAPDIPGVTDAGCEQPTDQAAHPSPQEA